MAVVCNLLTAPCAANNADISPQISPNGITSRHPNTTATTTGHCHLSRAGPTVREEGEEKGEEEEAEINEKAHGQRETVNNGSGAGEDVGCVRRRRRKRVKTQGERASIDALLRQVVLDYCVCVCGILLLLH